MLEAIGSSESPEEPKGEAQCKEVRPLGLAQIIAIPKGLPQGLHQERLEVAETSSTEGLKSRGGST